MIAKIKKLKIVVSHKPKQSKRPFGITTFSEKNKAKVQINLKQHYKKGKLDVAELASTVKHEMLHVKHPNMTEKDIYKKTAKTKIDPIEQRKLIVQLRNKTINQRVGVAKRQLKMKGEMKTGDLITKMNEDKKSRIIKSNHQLSKERLSIMGLV